MTATVTHPRPTGLRSIVPLWLRRSGSALRREWDAATFASSFPRGAFVGAMMLTLGVVGLGIWNAWTLFHGFQALQKTELRLERLAGTITHLDEVLTMSARMSAATSDPAWEERYKVHAPALEHALAQTIALAQNEPIGAALRQTVVANEKLVALELTALDLARQGHSLEAVELLGSPVYAELKRTYAEGVSRGVAMVHERVDAQVRAHSSRAALILALNAFSGAALMGGWLWVLRLVRVNARDRAMLVRDLHEAVKARDDFLALASHELRTPLNALSLAVQSLEGSSAPSCKLAIVERQVRRLDASVGALLDVSRITSGRLFLELEDGVDLAAVARDVVEKFGDQAARARCEVRLSGTERPILGRWDKMRLEQIIGNLLSNAIKYGAGKPIDVELSEADDVAVLAVRDYGIGIPLDKQGAIFDRFERAVSQREYCGVGLGLWIVREVATAMGGDVSVQSQCPEGTSFRVSLPKRPARP